MSRVIPSRPPTIAEAVEIIERTMTAEFCRAQIADWRERYGDEFADKVRQLALPKWIEKNKHRKKILFVK